MEPTRLDSMREWLEDALKPLLELELRSMFGGTGIYSEGTMFAILYAGRVYLKTDEKTREAFVQRGSEPSSHEKVRHWRATTRSRATFWTTMINSWLGRGGLFW